MELLTITELAEIIKMEPQSISNAINKKSLQIPFMKIGKFVRFDKKDVEDYLKSKKICYK